MASKQSQSLFGCSGCDRQWSGLSRCHCSSCHETFVGLAAFDLHRHYNVCRPPAERGLEFFEGLWREPDRALAS